MKIGYRLLLSPLFFLTLVGCKDDPAAPTISSEKGYSVTLPYDIKFGRTLSFTVSDDWRIENADPGLNILQTSGKSGANNIVVRAKDYNCTNDDLKYRFTITSSNEGGTTSVDVSVVHEPVFRIDNLSFEVDPMGGYCDFTFNTDADIYSVYNSLCLYYDRTSDFGDMVRATSGYMQSKSSDSEEMCAIPLSALTRSSIKPGEGENSYTINIVPNFSSNVRKGFFRLGIGTDGKMFSEEMVVVQPPANIYHSEDMETEDGKVTQLQKHTIGNGIPIVITGDGFVDKDIANGKFREATNRTIDALFSLHPMKALRDYFDVYEVTAVSYDGYIPYNTNYTNTAFSSMYESASSTSITGDDNRVIEYATKAIGESRLDDAVMIVLLNDGRYAGTCSMYTDYKKSDIPNGMSIAYVPLIESTDPYMEFSVVLCHEAVGHGFGKLDDEYYDEENGKMWAADKERLEQWQLFGCNRNVSLSSDVTKSYWANFASDSRYDFEKLGCYEGAAGYASDVYRPTETSIMNDNTHGFNVAGRVMIYKRCMKIAYGDKWKFNNADFVAFDLEAAKAESASSKRKAPVKRSAKFKPLGKPRLIMKK